MVGWSDEAIKKWLVDDQENRVRMIAQKEKSKCQEGASFVQTSTLAGTTQSKSNLWNWLATTLQSLGFERKNGKVVVRQREPIELVAFQCDGSMAEDWKETDRGIVVDQIRRKLPSGHPDGTQYHVVERPDGTRFEVYSGYVMPGEAYMSAHTHNPDESLVGKLVYTA